MSASAAGRLILAGCLLLLLAGCGFNPTRDGDPVRQAAARASESLVGTPYRWGGESPREGFDCSGLVWYAYRQAGVDLPRTADEQHRQLSPIDPRIAGPGDLLFFRVPRSDGLHVGVAVGGQRFVHAPSSGKGVSYASLTNPFWARCLVDGRRVTDAGRASARSPKARASKDDVAPTRLAAASQLGRNDGRHDDAGGLVQGILPSPLVEFFDGFSNPLGK